VVTRADDTVSYEHIAALFRCQTWTSNYDIDVQMQKQNRECGWYADPKFWDLHIYGLYSQTQMKL